MMSNRIAAKRLDFVAAIAPLVHFRILGGGHNWRGRPAPWSMGAATGDIDANQAMLDLPDTRPRRLN